MAATRYARPRLITADDKRYRAFVEQYILQRQNQRAMRPPRQRDIFGGQAENALRDWLATQLTLAETRILEYEEVRGRRASIKYRELDALALENRDSAWVFEIKASRTAESLHRALKQLRETCDILKLIFPRLSATILLVDTGIPTPEEVAALMSSAEAPLTPPETLVSALTGLSRLHLADSLDTCRTHWGDGATMLRFSVDDIVALVGAENLALNWEEDEEVVLTPLAPDAPPIYSSTEGEEGNEADNPLAAALRRAGLTRE